MWCFCPKGIISSKSKKTPDKPKYQDSLRNTWLLLFQKGKDQERHRKAGTMLKEMNGKAGLPHTIGDPGLHPRLKEKGKKLWWTRLEQPVQKLNMEC